MDLMQDIENKRLVIDHNVGRVVFSKNNKVYDCFVDLTIGVDYSELSNDTAEFWGKY
jgi:hypothetical protein